MPSPYLPPFEGPLRKATWARKIIIKLSETIENYKATATAAMKPDPHSAPHPDFHYFRMAFDPPMPEEIPFLLGDAIHNLRSSLDILICDVAELRGKRRLYKFPFAENEKQLRKIIDNDIRKLGNDVVKKIIDLRPFKEEGGNLNLRGLHDLDILDKHRVVLPFFWGRV